MNKNSCMLMMYAETLGDAFINPQALGECLHIQGCLLIQNVYTYRMSYSYRENVYTKVGHR